MLENLLELGHSNSRPQTYVPVSALEDSQECLIDRISTNQYRGAGLVAGIILGTASAVSDGSFKNAYGTSAGVLQALLDDEAEHHIVFANSMPGGIQ